MKSHKNVLNYNEMSLENEKHNIWNKKCTWWDYKQIRHGKKKSCVLKVIATEIVENETKKEKWEKKTYNFPVQKYQAIKHTYNWSPRQKKERHGQK